MILRRTVKSVDALQSVLGPSAPPARIAIEASREARHVHDKLRGWENEPVITQLTTTPGARPARA